jgi:hypothetical protein
VKVCSRRSLCALFAALWLTGTNALASRVQEVINPADPAIEQLPVADSAGSFNLRQSVSESQYRKILDEAGYDPSRSWGYGTSLAEILYLGDFADDTNIEEFTLQTLAELTGRSLDRMTLDDYPILRSQSLEDLVEAVPRLGEFPWTEVAPIEDLIRESATPSIIAQLQRETLAEILRGRYGEAIGDLSLNDLPLDRYLLESIPNVELAQLGSFEGYKQLGFSDVPGLSEVPLSRYLVAPASQDGLSLPIALARADLVLGKKEQQRLRTVTGSFKEGFKVPCDKKQCRHIELYDISILGGALQSEVRGKAWISGLDQKVRGGSGCLGGLNGGKEPTGRHPFGNVFKVVLLDTNEPEGKARFGLFFRLSIFCGKSPYFIGPVPWLSVREKDVVFLGFDDISDLGGGGDGASDIPIPQPSQEPVTPDNLTRPNSSGRQEGGGQTDPPPSSGQLSYPLNSHYPVSSEYGDRIHPVTGEHSHHSGIDLAAPAGTDVVAPAGGRVKNIAYNLGSCGNYIRIDHGNGTETGYCHLQSVREDLKVGDSLDEGEAFARVGNTGVGTGPHLHFIVYKNGSTVDPRSTGIQF